MFLQHFHHTVKHEHIQTRTFLSHVNQHTLSANGADRDGWQQYESEKMPKEKKHGEEKNLKNLRVSKKEKDRGCVRSKLFIILAAESHLQATVQMEKV